jgi:hypothetical protein
MSAGRRILTVAIVGFDMRPICRFCSELKWRPGLYVAWFCVGGSDVLRVAVGSGAAVLGHVVPKGDETVGGSFSRPQR